MTKLEQVISELCPNGVEYKKLGEVLTIKNGKDYKGFAEGEIPVYGTGGIMTYIDTFVCDKPSVLIPRKGSLDKFYYVDVPFWTVDTIFWTDINPTTIVPKFVYYYLQMQHLEDLNTAGGVPSLTQTLLNSVKIPLPPLPVQQEIVRILDNFTEYTAALIEELTAELTARKKQYEYYRNELLTFDKTDDRQVQWLKLSDIFTMRNGYTPSKAQKDFWEGDNANIPWFRMEDIRRNVRILSDSIQHITPQAVKGKLFPANSIIMATTATIGEHALLIADSLANH